MPGSYVGAAPTRWSDRSCLQCGPDTFTADYNQPDCADWTVCPSGTSFVSSPGRPWVDTQCSPCSENGCTKFCSETGTCLECLSYTDCAAGQACADGACKVLDCADPAYVYFTESFQSGPNAQWWSLTGAWEVGPAVAWSDDPHATPGTAFEDPGVDHTGGSDHTLAGVTLGGPVPAEVMPFPAYLMSPTIDISTGPSPVYLEFWSWLSADTMPFLNHSIEIFDGDHWIVLWSGPPEGGTVISEHAWQHQKYDVTAYRSDRFRVRFAYEVRHMDAKPVGSWSIDDVRIANTLTSDN
jgi:hypothetical protein